MTIRELAFANCYRCDKEIMAAKGDVHPLCAVCQQSFDDWFNKQLTMFDKDN